MIGNIVLLLLVNSLLPLLPIPPIIFAPVPIASRYFLQPTAYSQLNLTRLHTPQDFKKSFRQSLKIYHPDRGGTQQTFDQIKSLKKIMELQNNYYDLLNVTHVDFEFNQKVSQVIQSKQMYAYVSCAIFYLVAIFYSLAFTVEDDMRASRKVILPLIIVFLAYQYNIYTHSRNPTLIDFIDDKIPIFQQQTILRVCLSFLIAIVRTIYMRRETQQKKYKKQLLEQDKDYQYYLGTLIRLNLIYQEKLKKLQESKKSFSAKIGQWVSKILFILVIFSVLRGFFDSGPAQSSSQFET